MNLHERVLGVLSCKFVDEVVIGAPYVIDKLLIQSQDISLVVHGVDVPVAAEDGSDPYKAPKEMGIYKEIDSGSRVTTQIIIDRILANRRAFEERNAKKEAKEVQECEKTA